MNSIKAQMARIALMLRLMACFEHNYIGVLRIDETATIMIKREAKAHIDKGHLYRKQLLSDLVTGKSALLADLPTKPSINHNEFVI